MGGIKTTEIFFSAKTLKNSNQVYLLTVHPPFLYTLLFTVLFFRALANYFCLKIKYLQNKY